MLKDFPVILYKTYCPERKKTTGAAAILPAVCGRIMMKFFGNLWGDYVILAVHRVKDLEFDSLRGRMKVDYFAKVRGRIKYPEDIREIIQKIAYLVGYGGAADRFYPFSAYDRTARQSGGNE